MNDEPIAFIPHGSLTIDERRKIQSLLKTGISLSKIANFIGRSKNCVIIDVRFNGGRDKYDAEEAEKRAEKNRMQRYYSNGRNLNKDEEPIVKLVLQLYKKGASVIEMRKQSGFGQQKITAIIVNYLAELNIEKFIELEQRIAKLEGKDKVLIEEELSKDFLYKKYLNKEKK